MENGFVWYELITSDLPAAQRFYADVTGWTVEDAGMPGMTYLLARAGGDMVAGLMATPAEATGAPPAWTGYVGVDDVDASAARVATAGGVIHHPPSDIPGVGRFALVADPQGAAFALFGGGAVLHGPMEVSRRSWIVQARDPQGAVFALSGPRG